MKIEYSFQLGSFAKHLSNLLSDCSDLYSNHYGIWSSTAPEFAGQRIKLSPDRIIKWLEPEGAVIVMAHIDEKLVGYAIAIQEKVPDYGHISWVTQLVVHTQHRHHGIGKTLLFAIWGLSHHFAWGILSSSPYAIRALEKATRRRCIPKRIMKNKRKLINYGRQNVFFFENANVEIFHDVARCETNFFADHSELDDMLERVTSDEVPWLLGPLQEGWEWFAFTFQDQEQLQLAPDEIEEMLNASDQITKIAYSRMQLDSSHLWAQHADKEAQFIIEYCKLVTGGTVLDLGCGKGRHSILLAKSGLEITGVDYVEDLVKSACMRAKTLNTNQPQFIQGDCRDIDLEKKFNSVICLYDVVGSYPEISDNIKIIRNIAFHLKPGGVTLISVMNYELTEFKAKHFFSLNNDPNKLLELPPSQTMEKTGDVFNPDYFMIDRDSCIVYRKEQFLIGKSLPVELIVRDRRFRKEEIMQMCESVGLNVLWARYISAGNWNTPLNPTHDNAKEILLLCEKPDEVATLPVELHERLF